MEGQIQILDCTLRDGGLGLEDAEKNNIAFKKFSLHDRERVARHLSESKLDIIELGSIEITQDDRTGFAIYPDIETISAIMPKKKGENQIFAALYRGPDTPIENIPEWNPSLCEAVRVILRYSELEKSVKFCEALARKGYKVFVQPMLTMRYTDAEIEYLIDAANKMNAYALYFVDSYGYMQHEDVQTLFEKYDYYLNPQIKIGFHAHNNMNLAFSNVLYFLSRRNSRDIIVDSCLLGMGQGAGNLQTELFVGYYNEHIKHKYDFNNILDGCEIIEGYNKSGLWGYSVTRLLPALRKTAYKYAIALRNQYQCSYKEINNILMSIPEDLRHRYTPENTVSLLKRAGYDNKKINIRGEK